MDTMHPISDTLLSKNCRYDISVSAGLRTCIHNLDQLGLFATCDLRFHQQSSGAIAFLETFAPHSKDLTFSSSQALAHMKLAHAHCTQHPTQWPKTAPDTTDSTDLEPLANSVNLVCLRISDGYVTSKNSCKLHSVELWGLET